MIWQKPRASRTGKSELRQAARTLFEPKVYLQRCIHRNKDLSVISNSKFSQQPPTQFGRINSQDLPSPILCTLHYAIGKVLFALAAAEAAEKIHRDDKDIEGDILHIPRMRDGETKRRDGLHYTLGNQFSIGALETAESSVLPQQ